MRISSGTGNTIGGTTAADRNIISGNTNNAIYISSASNTVDRQLPGHRLYRRRGHRQYRRLRIYVNAGNDNVIGAPNAGNVVAAGVAGIRIVECHRH